MTDKEKMLALMKGAIEKSPADETEIVALSYSTSLTRFANSTIHQNVHEENTMVIVRAAVGKKLGVSSVNRLDPVTLASALERAAATAKASPDVSGFPGFPAAEEAASVDSFSKRTATMSPEARADAVGKAAAIAAAKGQTISGIYRVTSRSLAVANSSDVEQHFDGTDAALSVFATDDNGISSSATACAIDIDDIPVEETARAASDKCEAAANPVSIEPGEYDVIISPRAIAEVLGWLSFTSFGAQQMQEGQSFMAGRVGEQVLGANVSIYDDGLDTAGVPVPFDFEGVPKKRVALIENGVVVGPVYDSLTAAKDGVASTGHAGVASFRGGPAPSNLFVAPGESSVEELLSSVKRGLMITNFHYLNGLLDTRKALFTGMTRDGTFLIEDGHVAGAVKNMRFTDSMVRALSNVGGISKERQVVARSWGGVGATTVPTLLLRDFKFTGSTEF